MKEQLPGGRFYDASANLQQQTQSVIHHNKIPERVFGILDFFLHYRPNYTTNEVFLMFVFNKTLQWLESLLDNKRESVIKESIKDGRKIRDMYIERLREIENNRKVTLREKQVALENKQRNLLKKKSKYTNDVLYYGLWQNTEDVDKILDELKGLAEKKKAILAQLRFRQKVLKQSVNDKKYFK